jgi:hypothetical protein
MSDIPRWKPRIIELTDHQRRIAELETEIEQLKRGEYICAKCGLRKDGEGLPEDF